jgi:hypothetical protein
VLSVPGRHLLRGHGCSREKVGHGHGGVLDVAHFPFERLAMRHLCGRHERGNPDAAAELANLQLIAELALELRFGAVLLPQQRRVAIARELAVDLQCLDLVDRFGKLAVAHAVTELARLLQHELATDVIVEQTLLLRLHEFLGQLVAQRLFELSLPVLPGLADHFERDAARR